MTTRTPQDRARRAALSDAAAGHYPKTADHVVIADRTAPASTLDGTPDVARLTQRQGHGQDCVYCGVVLTPDTAVSLGEHAYRVGGMDYLISWWPLACRRHAEGGEA